MTETMELGPCQVRRKTDDPCPHPAAVEIWGVPFCERCAREQEAYFAVGELTQRRRPAVGYRAGPVRGLRDDPLVEALSRMRLELTSVSR